MRAKKVELGISDGIDSYTRIESLDKINSPSLFSTFLNLRGSRDSMLNSEYSQKILDSFNLTKNQIPSKEMIEQVLEKKELKLITDPALWGPSWLDPEFAMAAYNKRTREILIRPSDLLSSTGIVFLTHELSHAFDPGLSFLNFNILELRAELSAIIVREYFKLKDKNKVGLLYLSLYINSYLPIPIKEREDIFKQAQEISEKVIQCLSPLYEGE